ncbi:DUF4825 domain-containing protein [Anaerosporobacter sp.]
MGDRLRCEVVRDLLPSYVEGLTSDVTNEEIDLHISSCKECERLYNEMKAPIETPMETKEIDYLKKVKKRTNKTIFVGYTIIVAMLFLIIGIRMYIVGSEVNSIGNYNSLISKTNDGTEVLVVQGELANRSRVYKKHNITVEDGTATIKLTDRVALPWEDYNDFYVGYEIPNDVNRVVLNEDVIWEDGVIITKEANEIYDTKHPYVGEMPANGRTAVALQITKFGQYLNSLQTKEEPYGWTLEFSDTITKDKIFNERMTQNAYVILSLIDNLGELSWQYNNGSEIITKTVTTEDATKALGQDIKEYSNSISQFQKLLNELYL